MTRNRRADSASSSSGAVLLSPQPQACDDDAGSDSNSNNSNESSGNCSGNSSTVHVAEDTTPDMNTAVAQVTAASIQVYGYSNSSCVLVICCNMEFWY
jgi:hypothetical protein